LLTGGRSRGNRSITNVWQIRNGLHCHASHLKTDEETSSRYAGRANRHEAKPQENAEARRPRNACAECRDHRCVDNGVGLNAVHHKGSEPYVESQPWLELRGTATEPVNGVTDVKISMWLRETPRVGTARPASVGAVLGAKPELSFGLSRLPDAFDRVWVLALNGHLKFAHVCFTKPHYNSGLVVSATFPMNWRSDERPCRLERHAPPRRTTALLSVSAALKDG